MLKVKIKLEFKYNLQIPLIALKDKNILFFSKLSIVKLCVKVFCNIL